MSELPVSVLIGTRNEKRGAGWLTGAFRHGKSVLRHTIGMHRGRDLGAYPASGFGMKSAAVAKVGFRCPEGFSSSAFNQFTAVGLKSGIREMENAFPSFTPGVFPAFAAACGEQK